MCCDGYLGMDYQVAIEKILENTSLELTYDYELWYDSDKCEIKPVSPNTIAGTYDFLDEPRHKRFNSRGII